MKIGLIGKVNPIDKRASSGTIYTMCKALEALDYTIVWIPMYESLLYLIYDKIIRLCNKVIGKSIMSGHTPIGAYLLSKTVSTKKFDECDVLFAPFSSPALYSFKTNKKTIYLSDATFHVMVDYYFKPMPAFAIRYGDAVEKMAMEKSNVIVFSSNWAGNSAIKDYLQDEKKIKVVEFGSNICEEDFVYKNKDYDGTLNILFSGVDWKRKGGDVAINTVKWLNENGIDATLYIVGIKELKEEYANLPYVKNCGFLNKNHPNEYKELVSIMKNMHCLLLPTIAECSAIVFCEACAYSMPVFTHDTGGVSNYIENAYNGYTLPIGSDGKDFGEIIRDSYKSGDLQSMSINCRKAYETKLNWNTWALRMKSIIDELVND